MAVKFANNVSTSLSAAINATQTTISVADASGLPTLSSGDYVYLTLDTDTNSPTIEVVKVTAISSNDLTVVRGQDGTTASSFSNGTKIELRVTAAALDDISSAADTESVSRDGDTMTGTLNFTSAANPLISSQYGEVLWHDDQFSQDLIKQVYVNGIGDYLQLRAGGNGSNVDHKFGETYADLGGYLKIDGTTVINSSRALQNVTADASIITSGILHPSRIPIPVNGSWWNNGYVRVQTDGVMEVGKYLDFHTSNSGGNTDFDVRVTASSGAIDIDGDLTVDDITAADITATGDVAIGGSHTPLNPLHVREYGGTHLLALETAYDTARSGRGQISWRDGANITGGIWTEYDSQQVSMRFGNLYNSGYNTNTSMVLRGDGTLLLGKTSSGFNTVGVEVQPTRILATRSDGQALQVNRKGSDGAIISLHRDGTEIGSIQGRSGDLLIGTTDIGLRFDDNAQAYIPFNVTTSTGRDAAIDLGHSSVRYKDLYLSGSITSNDLVTENNTTKDSQGPYDWVTVGSGSRAAALRINDIAGANYLIRAGGYGLRFMKHVDAATDSFSDIMRFTATGVGDTTPNVVITNYLTVGGVTNTGSHFNVNSSGYLLKANVSSWSSSGNNDQAVLWNGYNSTIGDHIVLKAMGNGTAHGAIVIADNVFSYGSTTSQISTSASLTNPLSNSTAFTVTPTGNATFAGTLASNKIFVNPQNATTEGGEIALLGAGSNEDINIDNYNGTFRIFDGSAPTNRLNLNSAGDATFSGKVTATTFVASGGDSTPAGTTFANVFKGPSNIRTAYFDGTGATVSTWYGVGNNPFAAIDAQDGYLRLYINDTSGNWYERVSMTINGVTSHANHTVIGQYVHLDSPNYAFFRADGTANNWKYLSLQTNGTADWDIATKNDDLSGALQFRIGGGPTNRTYMDTSGNWTMQGDVQVTTHEFRVSSSNSYTTHFNYLNLGQNYISQGNSGLTQFRNSNGTLMEINSSGNVSIANDLTVSGDLNVAGTVNTVNTTTLQVEDKNIVLNYGSGDTSSSADGAGITIQDGVNGTTDATILWNGSSDQFDFSHKINISGNLQSWNVYSQDFYVLNTAGNGWHKWGERNSNRINLNVNSIETYGASYFAGGGTTVPAVHIRSSGNSWSEGLAIHPIADSGYALTFYRTKASYTDRTNTWAMGNLGGTGYQNYFGLLKKGLTGGVADRTSDAIFTVDPSNGRFKFGFDPYVGGNKIWHAGNDGPNSALDADTVDGIHGASLLRSDAADTGASSTSTALTLGYIVNNNIIVGNGTTSFADTYDNSPWYGIGRTNVNGFYTGQNKAQLAFYWGLVLRSAQSRIELSPAASGPILFGDGGTNNYAKITSSGIYVGSSTNNVVWHAGNDGPNSTLDADTVDGIQGASLLRSDAADTATGVITFDQATQLFRKNNATNYTNGSLIVESYGGSSSIAAMGFHISGQLGRMLSMDSSGLLSWQDSFSASGSITTSGNLTATGNLSVSGNTNLGNNNGDYTHINDILFLGATDSGDSHFYFGENSSNWYGEHWYWDSGHTTNRYSRHAGTDTLIEKHDTRYTHKLQVNRAYERLSHSTGYQIGSYNSVAANSGKTNPIYTIGDNYRPTDTSLSNMYGIGFATSNLWGSGKTEGWGMYVVDNGNVQVTLGEGSTSGWFSNNIKVEGSVDANAKRHDFGGSTGWDSVGFSYQTNVHMQGHNHFWVGAGNGTWFTGTANTKNQASGLAADGGVAHDLLLTTMYGASGVDRGITFAVADSTSGGDAGTSGWRLGKWHSGDARDASKLVVDGQLFAKGGYTDEYDYYADDYSAYYSTQGGTSQWTGDSGGGWHVPGIVSSTALQIQSSNYTTSTRKPQLQFHQYGYGGVAFEYDGPNDTLNIIGNSGRLSNTGFKQQGNTIWHAGNDGPSSGLDADTIDGAQLTSLMNASNTTYSSASNWSSTIFPLSSANTLLWNSVHNSTSSWTDSPQSVFSNAYTYGGVENVRLGNMQVQVYWPHLASNGNGVYYRTGWNGSGTSPHFYTWRVFLDSGNINSYAWTSSNDGPNSGLDADTLDGEHKSYFYAASNPSGYITASGTANQSHMVSGSAFGTTSSPGSVLEYQQAVSQTDTKLAPSTDWHNSIRMGHGNPYTYYSSTIAVRMTGTGTGDLYTQNIGNGSANGWRKHWSDANDGSGSGLDADMLDGQQLSSIDHAEGFKLWGTVSASGGTARRFHIGRLYGCAAHWDSDWQNIEFHITAEGYESGTLKYRIQGDYGGAGSQANMLKLYLTEAHGPMIPRFRLVLGTVTDAGWDHSGQDTFYVDLYAEAAYYSSWKVHAKTYGHPYVETNPSSGGATTVFYSSPTITNISDFSVSHNDIYQNGGKIWTEHNDGATSGLDADLLDGQHGSYYQPASTAITTANIGSQSVHSASNIDGRGFTNTGSNSGTNADTINSNGISYYTAGVTNFSGNATDGALYSQYYSGSWQHQIAGDYRSGQIAVRGKNNNTWQSWYKVWSANNDGPNSGLDADTLDGQHKSYYEHPVSPMTTNGNMNNVAGASGHYASVQFYNMYTPSGSGNQANYNVPEDGGSHYHVQQFNGYNSGINNWKYQIAHSFYNGRMYHRNQYDTTWQGWAKVWDSDSDGASSGLDADTVDGYHASNLPYVPAAGSWAGDLTSNGYTRHTGVNTSGGEFALLEKNAQMSTLIDGDYFAYEAGGFWSSSNSAYGNASGFKATAANEISVTQKDGGTANLKVTGTTRLSDGTVSAPSLYFGSDANTGFYHAPASDFFSVTNGGSNSVSFGPTDTYFYRESIFNNGANSSITTPNITSAEDDTTATTTSYHINFVRSSGTSTGRIGGITSNYYSTSYATSSDYRLKENVNYDWDATTRLKQLRPCQFNWIGDTTNALIDGFLAHEVEDIVEDAVVGEKDATREIDGETVIDPQSIDQSKLVPLLVKTIQELEARIAALEAEATP